MWGAGPFPPFGASAHFSLAIGSGEARSDVERVSRLKQTIRGFPMNVNLPRRNFRQRAQPVAHRPRQRNGSSGNARQNYERYVALAREAALAGDTVQMENWYQHAEHYFRIMEGNRER